MPLSNRLLNFGDDSAEAIEEQIADEKGRITADFDFQGVDQQGLAIRGWLDLPATAVDRDILTRLIPPGAIRAFVGRLFVFDVGLIGPIAPESRMGDALQMITAVG